MLLHLGVRGHYFSIFMIILTALLAFDMMAGYFTAQFEVIPGIIRAVVWTALVVVGLLGSIVMIAYVRGRMHEMPSLFNPVWPLNLVTGLSVVLVPIAILSYAVWLGVYGGAPGPFLTIVLLEKFGFDEPVYMGLMITVAFLTLSWYIRIRYKLLAFWGLSSVSLFLSRLMFETQAVLVGQAGQQQLSVFLLLGGLFGLLALLAFWVAFTILFRHYSERMGGLSFWIMVLAPVVAAAGILLIPYRVFGSYGTLFTTGFLASGILWGLGFYLICRKASDKLVKSFFTATAFGQVIMMVSTLSIIFPKSLQANPQTFGVISAMFTVPSGIMFFWGLYATAVYVGIDQSIRREVQKATTELKELHLVRAIGDAEFLRQVESRVIRIARSLEEKTGMKEELADQDVKYYLDRVLQERLKASSSKAGS